MRLALPVDERRPFYIFCGLNLHFFALKWAALLVYSGWLGTLGISEQRTRPLRRIRL